MKLETEIRKMLLECGLTEDEADKENFIKEDLLNSLSMAELIIQLEDTYNFELDGEDIIPENFQNINMIANLVKKYVMS